MFTTAIGAAITTAKANVQSTFFEKTSVQDNHPAKSQIETLDKVRYGAGIVAVSAAALVAWKLLGILCLYGSIIEMSRETAQVASNVGNIRLNEDLSEQAKQSAEKCAEMVTERAPFAQTFVQATGIDLRARVLSAPAA
jgi:hypothetical protein